MRGHCWTGNMEIKLNTCFNQGITTNKTTNLMSLPLIYSIYRPLHPSWASCSHRLSPLSDLAQNSKHFLSNCKCDSKMSKCQILLCTTFQVHIWMFYFSTEIQNSKNCKYYINFFKYIEQVVDFKIKVFRPTCSTSST